MTPTTYLSCQVFRPHAAMRSSRERCSNRQRFLQRNDREVRVRLAQLFDGEMAARHADALDAGGVRALHVARRVAHDDGLFRADVVTVDQGRPLERDAGDLTPVTRV